ncbi:citrate/2-methylcitrate synthase [Paenibacillus apii]|uniref:citrate/2-methylcitrate synthase n=1 Tax=Paenibacillus apii TaxID=1850370 RepID=UPI00143B7ED7|nr:citrate/2-methylcitrate synthase [Paenibacillus apii]NJJ38618.1 citrate synthase/methylcitrate synthase [Paenibacillus apii]
MSRGLVLADGLEGVAAFETGLSLIDGDEGRISYRDYPAEAFQYDKSFEEVAYLLWYGKFPMTEKSEEFQRILAARRFLPKHVKLTLDQMPAEVDMMSVLQTAVSALKDCESTWPPSWDQASSIVSKIPTIIAYRQARLEGREMIEPRLDLNHTANYLYMLFGEVPTEIQQTMLETYLVLTQELGSNPSTFTARVVASTRSDLISSTSAAIGALKGPLHGGAPSEVLEMLREIKSVDRAEAWLRRALESDRRIMGFGHRIFKRQDPRSAMLKALALRFAADHPLVKLAVEVEETILRLLEEYKPGRRLVTNVDYYASVVLSVIGLKESLFTPTFAVSRSVGWCAHIMEQAMHNRLIYPQAVYSRDLHTRKPPAWFGRAIDTGLHEAEMPEVVL